MFLSCRQYANKVFESDLSSFQTEEFDEVQKKIREKFEKMFPDRLNQPVVSTTLMRRIEWRAAVVIQRAVRIFLDVIRARLIGVTLLLLLVLLLLLLLSVSFLTP